MGINSMTSPLCSDADLTYDVFMQQLVERVRYVHDWALVSNVLG